VPVTIKSVPTRTPNIPVGQQEDLVCGLILWQRVDQCTKFTISNSYGLPFAKVCIQDYIPTATAGRFIALSPAPDENPSLIYTVEVELIEPRRWW